MGNVLTKGTLLPEIVTGEMFNLVRGKSSLARLSGASPIPFNGERVFTFSLDKEIDIVAENDAKSNGGGTVGSVNIVPVKFEYGMRVSDEFRYGAEEVRLRYLQAFAEGFAAKVARGIDIAGMHGVNPRTGSPSGVVGDNNFDDKIENKVLFAAATANDNVTDAIALIEGAEHEVTGMAMAPAMRSALAAIKKGANSNEPLFPELAWGSNPGVLNGLPVDTNSTVSFNSGDDRAIVGNFRDFFRWGFAREIPIEVIEYGNPDNDAQAGDLKGHNQVYIRGEVYAGWAILVPEAFALITTNVE